ncbi:patatin-like phospholipase family protein [Salinisphaera sp.]|uniref:patatin-like phospholipase family protein n=1 Tax=Salinisphaera sp. TaxID=1914330 RepID=UPI002D78ACD0|nr:patatin-like phospholipase family protein [Salinisphaera sp.]HET7313956.1 patatin-like phospholipase family protein [Salinisphaera sp.]
MASAKPRRKALHEKPAEQEHYDKTVLLLQGGGALGAYQAGAYETLAEGGYAPDWVAGISIGAINAAIIVGNPPEERAAKLRAFWQRITRTFNWPAPDGDLPRRLFNTLNSLGVMTFGLPSFFRPRIPSPLLRPRGANGSTSFYDTSPLLDTLEELVDFERINHGDLRLTLGAVDVEKGNFECFDNTKRRIGPEHVLASGSLPPGFPPTEVDGRLYWDGGLTSNTQLSYVLKAMPVLNHVLIFQVDLWDARGAAPRNLFEVEARRKDIVYSSRTRLNTEFFQREFQLREAIAKLTERLPEEALNDSELTEYIDLGHWRSVSLVHLIYKEKRNETHARDYEFSRASMIDHWRAGRADAGHALTNPKWLPPRTDHKAGIRIFDMS